LLAEEPGAGDRRGTHAALERRLSEASRGEVRGVLAEASVLERIRVSETAINKLVAEPGAKEALDMRCSPTPICCLRNAARQVTSWRFSAQGHERRPLRAF
jgi:hypothetical protein